MFKCQIKIIRIKLLTYEKTKDHNYIGLILKIEYKGNFMGIPRALLRLKMALVPSYTFKLPVGY